MEAKWPSAEFHRPTHRPGMQMLPKSLPLFSECACAPTPFLCSNVISPQVSVIKVKIHEATGMPAGKQKLQYEVKICFKLVATCNVSSTLI